MVEPPSWLELLTEAGPRFLYRLPELVVYLSGLVLAAWVWRRQRRAAVLVLAGCLLLLLSSLGYEFFWVAILRSREWLGIQRVRLTTGWLYLQLVCSFLTGGGVLLLLLAAAAWRWPTAKLSWDSEQ